MTLLSAGLQNKYRMAGQRKRYQINFEQAQLHFRDARTPEQWWAAICNAAERMDFAWVSLKTTKKDGSIDTQLRRMAGSEPDLSKLMKSPYPRRCRPEGKPFKRLSCFVYIGVLHRELDT
jgi:hypothetical protein